MDRRLTVAAALLSLLPVPALAQAVATTPTNTWVTNGRVADAVARGNTVYLTGEFTRIGPRTGTWVAVDLVTGEAEPPEAQVNGPTLDAEPDDAGGYFLSGVFTKVGAASRSGLARVTSTGELDTSFAPSGFSSAVGAALVAGRLFAATATADVDGYTLRALDPSSGAPIAWTSPVTPTQAPRRGPNATVIVQSGAELVSLSASTGAVLWRTPFDLRDLNGAVGYGTEGLVIRRIDLTTGVASTIASGQGFCGYNPCGIYRLKYHDGALYFLGQFFSMQGVARPGEAAIDATTGDLLAWQKPRLSDLSVTAEFFSFRDKLLFVCAGATSEDVVLVPFDPQTGAADVLRVYLLGGSYLDVLDVLDDGVRMRIAGRFRGVGGVPRRSLAAVRWPDGEPLPWTGPALRQPWTHSLAITGTRLFHTDFDGLRELDAITGAQVGRVIPGSGLWRLAIAGTRLFVAGGVDIVDGAPRRGVASFDISNGDLVLEPWQVDVQAHRSVPSMLVVPPVVLLSGSFEEIAGQPRAGLAAVDMATGAPLPWPPPFTMGITAGGAVHFDRSPTRVFLSGAFAGWAGPGSGGQVAFELNGELSPWRPAMPPVVRRSPYFSEATLQRAIVFGNRIYTGLNYALDRDTGAVVPWTPELDFIDGGFWKPFDDLGLVLMAFGSSAGFYFYPKIDRPATVTGLTASVTGNTLQLSWNPAANARSYRIEAGSSSGSANLAALTTNATSFSTTAPSGVYYVRVLATNESGAGAASNELRVALGPDACAGPPHPPTGLMRIGTGQPVTLRWTAAAEGPSALGYVVHVGLSPHGPAIARFEIGANTTVAANAPEGTYIVAVTAENACGSSGPTTTTVIVQ